MIGLDIKSIILCHLEAEKCNKVWNLAESEITPYAFDDHYISPDMLVMEE